MSSNKLAVIYLVVIAITFVSVIISLVFYGSFNIKGSETADSRMYKIGIIYAGGVYEQAVNGLKDQLGQDGYSEGKNIQYFIENVEGDMNRIQEGINRIMANNPDLVYTISTPITSAVWKAVGNDFPIVFNIVGDPIGAGFAKEYKSSQTNLTGCSNSSAELSGKRLEVFQEAFPHMKKAVTIYNPDNAFSRLSIENTRKAAAILGIVLEEKLIKNKEELELELASLPANTYDGFYITPDAIVVSRIDSVVKRANELGIPTMGHEESLIDKGVTLSYGANFYELGIQCAIIVESVLKGKQPSAIPIQGPKKLEVVINEKSCTALGILPSTEIMGRADKIQR